MVSSASRRFEPTSGAVSAARQFVVDLLGPNRVDRGELALLVSELASNAVRHARTSFVVAVRDDTTTRVEVTDGSPLPPRVATGPRPDGGGHGLVLVDRLAPAWGYYPSGEGKTVWFETNRSSG
jgi:anti-sigma regulatory factor (Ser/Thr protein kinase)